MGQRGPQRQYHRLDNGTTVNGLVRRSNGRFVTYTVDSKGKSKEVTFGRDEALALRRFYQWQARGKSVEILSGRTFVSGLATLEPSGAVLPVDVGAETAETVSIEETHFWERVKKELLERPVYVAQQTGIKEIAWFYDWTPEKNVLLSDVGERYFKAKKGIIKDDTYQTALNVWNSFVECVNVNSVNQLTNALFSKFANTLPIEKKATRAINFRYIKAILKHGYEATIIPSGLYYKIRQAMYLPLKVAPQNAGKVYCFTPEDYNAMLSVASMKDKALGLMLMNCAFYPIDAVRITWDSVNLSKGYHDYRRLKRNQGNVVGIPRSAVLWQETIKALVALAELTGKGKEHYHKNLVFGDLLGIDSEKHRAYEIYTALRRMKRLAGLKNRPYRPEDFRNTASSLTGSFGLAREVLLGHSLGINQGYVTDDPTYTKDACAHLKRELKIG